MTTFEKLKNFVLGGVALGVAATGVACSNEPTDTSSIDESTKPSTSIVESSDSFENSFNSDVSYETSDEISNDISNTSCEVSDETSDTNQDNKITGAEVYDQIITMAIGSIAESNYMPYEMALEALGNIDISAVKISTENSMYNADYDCAVVNKTGKDNNEEQCAVWNVTYEIPGMEFSFVLGSLYVPVEDPSLIALCDNLGISTNKLSELNFAPEDFNTMDPSTAALLKSVMDKCTEFTPIATPTAEPEM